MEPAARRERETCHMILVRAISELESYFTISALPIPGKWTNTKPERKKENKARRGLKFVFASSCVCVK